MRQAHYAIRKIANRSPADLKVFNNAAFKAALRLGFTSLHPFPVGICEPSLTLAGRLMRPLGIDPPPCWPSRSSLKKAHSIAPYNAEKTPYRKRVAQPIICRNDASNGVC